MEGEREGEKHQCVDVSRVPPAGDLARNPGMSPDWESNRRSFGSQTRTQSTELHHPWPTFLFFPAPRNLILFYPVLFGRHSYLLTLFSNHHHDKKISFGNHFAQLAKLLKYTSVSFVLRGVSWRQHRPGFCFLMDSATFCWLKHFIHLY